MAVFTAIVAGLALATAAAGSYIQYQGQKAQSEAQKRAIDSQQQADDYRKQQMELDANRRRREMVRQAVTANSMALSMSTNQGASFGSGLPGAFSQIYGQTGVNMLGVNQNEEIGGNIFAANRNTSNAYKDAASAGSYAAMGAGLKSLGGAVLNNLGMIDRVGNYASDTFGKIGAWGSGKMFSTYGATG